MRAQSYSYCSLTLLVQTLEKVAIAVLWLLYYNQDIFKIYKDPKAVKYLEEGVQVSAPAWRTERLEIVLLESGVFPAAAGKHLLRQLRLAFDPPHRVRRAPRHLERFARHLQRRS